MGVSSTAPTKLETPHIPQPPSASSSEASISSLPSDSLSSTPVISLGTLYRNPSPPTRQDLTTDRTEKRSLFSPSQGSEHLFNSERGNKNDTNNPVAEQLTQSFFNGNASQKSSPLNSKNEHQTHNSLNNEQVNNIPGLNNLSKRSSSVQQHLNTKKNQIDKARAKFPSYKSKAKLGSNTGQLGSGRSHLLVSSEMEFGGYLDDGTNLHDEDQSRRDEKTPFFVYYLACFATIGGFLFGYDTGIVSGAILLIKDYFELSTMWQEAIVSGTVGAAAVFSLLAGFMCDFFGRKVTIMAASVVFVVGAVIMGAAGTTAVLLTGRIVVGVGIGFASMTVPVYIAEAAPSAIRGRLVTLNQLFITIGILISSLVAGAFSSMKTTGWRYMLGLAGVPGIIQFIGFLYLPESPRWLVMKGKDEQATKVLQRIRGKEDVHDEMKEIMNSVEEDKNQEGFVLGRVIHTQHVRKALFVGCGLQVFQQLCGINTVILISSIMPLRCQTVVNSVPKVLLALGVLVFTKSSIVTFWNSVLPSYYSATILTMAGFPTEAAIWLVLVPNGINFLATFIGITLVERLGRKKLLVASFIGVITGLVVLAVGFQLSANFSPSINHNVTETGFNGTHLVDGCYDQNYENCEQCIEHKDCGFCFIGSGDQGSCLRVEKNNEDTLSEFGRCHNQTLKTILNLKFAHGYCPTNYTWMAVLGLALFVLAFAPGLGPMPWTINSEIYPMWARSTCTSIATGANWICNLLVSLFFLTLTETITKYGAFWLFGGLCFIGMVFTIAFLPETKNKSLEEVEELFKDSKNQGKDNLGYERDRPTSVRSSNTKL